MRAKPASSCELKDPVTLFTPDRMKNSLFAIVLMTAGILPASAQTVVDDIVARVNDSIITRSDLLHSREQLQTEAKQQPGAEAKLPAKEKDLLRDLIDQQ